MKRLVCRRVLGDKVQPYHRHIAEVPAPVKITLVRFPCALAWTSFKSFPKLFDFHDKVSRFLAKAQVADEFHVS